MEFQNAVLMMYPDMVNREALFDDLLKKFKKDPRLIKMPQGMGQMNPMMPQQGGTPMSKQVVQKQTGGASLQTPGLNKLMS